MLQRISGAMLALLGLTGPGLAWGWTDIYIERAAMAEAGLRVCNIDNRSLAARYKDRAGFYTGLSQQAVERRVDAHAQVLTDRLTNVSAVQTFCARVRVKDF